MRRVWLSLEITRHFRSGVGRCFRAEAFTIGTCVIQVALGKILTHSLNRHMLAACRPPRFLTCPVLGTVIQHPDHIMDILTILATIIHRTTLNLLNMPNIFIRPTLLALLTGPRVVTSILVTRITVILVNSKTILDPITHESAKLPVYCKYLFYELALLLFFLFLHITISSAFIWWVMYGLGVAKGDL